MKEDIISRITQVYFEKKKLPLYQIGVEPKTYQLVH